MTEFLEQNNLSLWLKFKSKFKENITYRITIIMLFFWVLVDIVLLSLVHVSISNIDNNWKIISGFNLGAVGSLFGFLTLSFGSKGLFSKVAFKQVLAYFTFLIRMLIYGIIIGLTFYFKFFNLISIIAGFSLLIIAIIISEFLLLRKVRKGKKKC